MSIEVAIVVIINFVVSFLLQLLLYKTINKRFEKFKSDMIFETSKKEFIFTKFHALKLESIVTVYSDLIDVEENLDDILVFIKNLKSSNYETTSSQKDLINNYCKNKFKYSSKKSEIFFNEEISKMLKEFRGRVYNTIREIESIDPIASSSETINKRKSQMLKETEDNIMRVFDEIPELKDKLKKVLKESMQRED